MNSAQSPVRHLDLATPAFYHYRKNPKCYHTVWGKKCWESRILNPKNMHVVFKPKMHQNTTCFETVWTHENIPSQWDGYEAFEKG